VCLEDERGERSIIDGVNLDSSVALGSDEGMQLLHLVSGGHQLDELRQ
jgi:hypothetical protein